MVLSRRSYSNAFSFSSIPSASATIFRHAPHFRIFSRSRRRLLQPIKSRTTLLPDIHTYKPNHRLRPKQIQRVALARNNRINPPSIMTAQRVYEPDVEVIGGD